MADKKPLVAEAKVTLDKERTMRLDFFACREFKKLTKAEGLGPLDVYGRPKGISLLTDDVGKLELDEEITPLLIAACLRHEDADVDGGTVARSLNVDTMDNLATALQGLLREFFPDATVEVVEGEEGESESAEVSDGTDP